MSLFDAIRSMVTTDHRKYHGETPMRLYRCTECGYLGFTLGGTHAHIEGHRRIWNFWRIGWDVEWLQERTEKLYLVEVEPHPPRIVDPKDAEIGSQFGAPNLGDNDG